MSLPHGHGPDAPQLSFPCAFDIKAMGRHSPDFEARMRELVSRHVAPPDLHAVSTRPSRQNQYVSVTLSITASGYDQLNAIYQDLAACAEVLFAL
jgi:putative lipoic acid-binding regulatory protein